MKPIDTEFERIQKKFVDNEIKISIDEDFPNRESYIKRALKLGLERDPKKFVRGWRKLTGATQFDVPNELYKYS